MIKGQGECKWTLATLHASYAIFCFIIDLAEEEVSSTENEEKNKVHYCQQKGSLCYHSRVGDNIFILIFFEQYRNYRFDKRM